MSIRETIFCFAVIPLFVACGEDSGTSAEPEESSAESSSSSIQAKSSSSIDAVSSSSFSEISSSSVAPSSSSADPLHEWSWDVPKEDRLNPDIAYDSITDSRDGKVYRTVKIGDQEWMAENLSYGDSVQTPSLKERSWCFDDVPEHCNVTGRLYTWAAAIDSAALANDFSGDIQGICPDGWHLPSSDEWSSLITVAGDKGNAVLALRSSNGWGYANGTDDFGFSMLPSGQKQGRDYFSESAYFWTSSESDEHAWDAYYVYTKDISAGLKTPAQHAINIHPAGDKANAFSIRCVKDAETPKKAPSHLYF